MQMNGVAGATVEDQAGVAQRKVSARTIWIVAGVAACDNSDRLECPIVRDLEGLPRVATRHLLPLVNLAVSA